MNVQERLLKYVSFWTTSDEESGTTPSSPREFELARALEEELNALHLSNVKVDEHCYVYGLLKATKGYENYKSIAFISHLDTALDASGENVKPQVIPNYDGKDVILKGTGELLKVSDFPELKDFIGRTLITTDGTTLLGADDKAGIAEIMTAIEEIIKEDLPHGDIWVAFTPDEEIGSGAHLFDFNYCNADYAYTMDGDYEGEIAYDNFNAAAASFTIKGVSVHPGSAKNIMINAANVACEIQSMLPQDQTPAHTEGREGFFHLTAMSGDVNTASLSFIVRDHDKDLFEQKKELLISITEKLNQKYHADTVTLKLDDTYFNMLEIIKQHPYVVERAKEAIQKVGLTLTSNPVRGGTDGSSLSFRGLPCPNLGTGGYGFHGPFEHITVEGMENAIKIIKEIVSNPIEK